jgi:hypothetical protein
MARMKGRSDGTGPRDLGPEIDETQGALGVSAPRRPWLRVDNEALWDVPWEAQRLILQLGSASWKSFRPSLVTLR